MNKIVALLLIATGAMTFGSSEAAAWTCGASSATGGWGLGWAPSLYRAKRIALVKCAAHTPRGHMCYLVRCRV